MLSTDEHARQFALARKLEAEDQQASARQLFAQLGAGGDVEALTALGQNMLIRQPLDQYEGVKTIIEAANRGGGEAIHFCGTMSALGSGLPQDWKMALDCLQGSAERAWAPAQSELRVLAGTSEGSWAALRDAIDLPALLKPGEMRTVHTTPRISVMEKFLSPEFCDWLIAHATPRLASARVFDPVYGAKVDPIRNNKVAELEFTDMNIALALIRARISALTGLAMVGMENTQILHYRPGQRVLPHYDYLNAGHPRVAEAIAQGGQREATFLVYLNDDFDGAETEFLQLDWRFRGGKGDAILFWNVDENCTPEKASLHAGLEPLRGEKWLMSQWVRRRPR